MIYIIPDLCIDTNISPIYAIASFMAILSILANMAWHVMVLNMANIGVHVKKM